jgi:curli biogenesis system outer membrane secretion channel CsgG
MHYLKIVLNLNLREVIMKKSVVIAVLILVIFMVSQAMAQEKPRLGVLRFTNDTRAGWWTGTAGRDLQDMLAAELVSMDSFQVLERKELEAVLSEQDLGASGRVDKKTAAKIGKVKGAKYLVAGTVSAFEEGTSGKGGGVSIMGLSVGGKKERAYMAVDLKVIDTETGEIADARTVEATSESTGTRVGISVPFVSTGFQNHEKTPTGKAIRACIIEIAEYLDCSLAKGKNDPCMQEYKVKESKRREKTKSSIKLE